MSIIRTTLPLVAALLLGAGVASAQLYEGTLGEGSEQLPTGEYYDWIEVDAEAGDELYAEIGSEDFDPYLILIGPSGDVTESSSWSEFTGETVFEESGTWLVIVTTEEPGQSGDYNLKLYLENYGEEVEVD